MPTPAPVAPVRLRRLSRAARRRRRSRRIGRSLLVLVLAALVGTGSFVGGLLAAPADVALPPAPQPALLYAADGTTQLGAIRPASRREPVPIEQIPQAMREAIISAEDERFLEHSGVDVRATLRAAYNDLTGGRLQGGSTITQQYVKNATAQDDATITRKIREASLAVRLEQRLSKEQILTDYLNVLYLGNGTFGVQAASKYYFDVPVADLALDPATGRRSRVLEVARAALLAGLVPAPSAWNPVAAPETSKARQRYTLNRMVVNGHISPQEASEAYELELVPVRATVPEPPSSAPEFTDVLKQRLREDYATAPDGQAAEQAGELSEDRLFRDGLRVTSTLDTRLQAALSQALQETLPDADDPQGAAVAIDTTTGDVKAMTTLRRVPPRTRTTGETSPAVDGYTRDGLNLATQGYRSTGSTIKPFTLAAALQAGRTLDDRVPAPARDDIACPTEEDGVYSYGNAGGEGSGSRTTTLRSALARSVNTVFVPLALEVGTDRIRDLMVASGFKTRPGNDLAYAPVCSFGLGTTAEVSPLSVASAYATLMNGGVRNEPRFYKEVRTGGEGTDPGVVRPGEGAPEPGVRAMPQEVADQVVEAMSRVATSGGTAPRAAQPFTVYGKTGTTNDSTNAWFVGCAEAPQNLCVAVWMGYEYTDGCELVDGPCGGMRDVNGVEQVYGGTLPARVFDRAFDLLREAPAPPGPLASVG